MKNVGFAFLLGMMLIPLSVKGECVAPPDCEELGFTADASKCKGAFLKCPWDLGKAACDDSVETPLPVIYGDGTVVSKIVKGKTPIGVVFDEVNKLAVSLTFVKSDGSKHISGEPSSMAWSTGLCDVAGLDNCTDESSLNTCGIDGRKNVDAILSSTCSGTAVAALASNKYEPEGCLESFCKKTNWFVPSMRDLGNIFVLKDDINTTLVLINEAGFYTLEIKEGYSWSSTENSKASAWRYGMMGGVKSGNASKSSTVGALRAVVSYGN